ncbi:hypothetical protein [Kerstersia gyiorum]|uniref:hypothetical protein n=1 Tax=Kerstersia gyiorum TaxID=206506 RepID=UPI00209E03D9|nr:hypothetical protein [Kerstersia gyiorum]MCP1679408.1 hypothetical protein [Kerstersia gyiorum]MCP1823911.1 hypothetical protein [Kerstersia gyiorum]MCP1827352.1 hypothetical protein [Kerstersia gyiorum]MCW2448999.1 hypothetical protein [Kerstersia gyiorum]
MAGFFDDLPDAKPAQTKAASPASFFDDLPDADQGSGTATVSASGDVRHMRLEASHSSSPQSPIGATGSWEQEEPGFFERAGNTIKEVGRQVGLTARYGLEGLGQASQLFTEPIRIAVVNPAARALGLPEAEPSGQVMSTFADLVGLPSPANARERVVGDAARMMAGGGGLLKASQMAASALTGPVQTATMRAIEGGLVPAKYVRAAQGSIGVPGSAFTSLAANPGQQLAAAIGAGASGGAVREAGGGELAQAAAALAGGVGAGIVSQSLMDIGRKSARAADRVFRQFSPARAQRMENTIEVTLRQSGIDWSDVPERIRQGMRAEVEKALRTGDDLDPAALRRLLDFQRVPGATPTRGMLSQDPVQITREMNLAKTGANATGEGLQGLARVQNENNRALIEALNQAGAGSADDAYTAGVRLIGSLERGIDAERASVGRLYDAARDSQGRSFPLDGRSFADRAIQSLDDDLVGGFLPPQVRDHLNRISAGEVPFTVDYAEQLKTLIGNIQRRSTDGNARHALGLVRSALDDTPVLGLGEQTAAMGARAVNPGNLPAVPGSADLGQDAIEAFGRARAANRQMMQRIERNPALKAIFDEKATPEQFVNRFIIGHGAKADDVRSLAHEIINVDPRGMDVARGQIARWLKESAIGPGTADEVGKFSASGFRRALDSIGQEKLRAFFTPEEIAQLRSISNVANYMTAQPVGSAVNNSNSGALMLGKGIDLLDSLASKVPFLKLGDQIQVITRGIQQGQAQRVAPALVAPAQRATGSAARPALTFGALFATPPVDGREDD